MVREKKLDLGIAFDPDGDRFSCVDETGTPLGEEATIVLACRYVLPKERVRNPKSEALRVVVNLSTTRAVEDVCAEFGARVERTPVGEIHVIDRMRAVGAVLGGEGNGGVILPEVNYTRDGLVAAAVVLNLVRESGGPLSAIRQSLPQYLMAKTTVQLGRKAFDERAERLLAAFAGMRADRQDGLRLDGEDCWIHVRPSNTEPLVRIIAEARVQKKVDELVRQAQEGLTGNGREKE
jgi:phosphomannomutase